MPEIPINQIICGSALEVMKEFPDNSIDAVITDPPYELGFMGKAWDKSGITYNPVLWQEVLRVLKPGGYLLSFGGTRTYHRLACAIEDAGFEIRDCIMWVYGSGFPKSLNIGKVIDKLQGNKREDLGTKQHAKKDFKDNLYAQDPANRNNKKIFGYGKEKITKGNSVYEGWGTALKPAVEPIVVARKPLSERNVALNVLKWGTGGINIDESRIGNEKIQVHHTPKGTFAGGEPRKSDTNYYNNQGRFPANLILECICDEVIEGKIMKPKNPKRFQKTDGGIFMASPLNKTIAPDFDRNKKSIIHTNPECPCYMLDEQSGELKSGARKAQGWSDKRNVWNKMGGSNCMASQGGASRFFYQAKASRRERGKNNNHPTVKPIKLMEYLVRLVTSPKGIVLDPFAGSGSTLIACKKLGFNWTGIEKEKDYCKIAERRLMNVIPDMFLTKK